MNQMLRKLPKHFSQLNHVPIFYKNVTIENFEPIPGALTVKLDQRALKTPDEHKYFLRSRVLAEIVRKEFLNQREYILPTTMPIVTILL